VSCWICLKIAPNWVVPAVCPFRSMRDFYKLGKTNGTRMPSKDCYLTTANRWHVLHLWHGFQLIACFLAPVSPLSASLTSLSPASASFLATNVLYVFWIR
jgi:hypothetical protein